MAIKNYVFYQKTSPFPGWIRFVDQVDVDQVPDGSTKKERFVQLLIKFPDSAIKQFPLGDLPDPKAVKFDIATETFVPLEPGDITPKVQEELDQAQKAQDIIDNLPSWGAIENVFTSIKANAAAATTLGQLKTALAPLLNFSEKHTRITYWLAKNKKD